MSVSRLEQEMCLIHGKSWQFVGCGISVLHQAHVSICHLLRLGVCESSQAQVASGRHHCSFPSRPLYEVAFPGGHRPGRRSIVEVDIVDDIGTDLLFTWLAYCREIQNLLRY